MRAGKRALLVAEQFRLDQFARDGRHVDRHERTVAPPAVVVQRARDQLLAGARFAGNEYRQIGLREPRHDPVDILHRRGAAHERELLIRGWADRAPAFSAPSSRA